MNQDKYIFAELTDLYHTGPLTELLKTVKETNMSNSSLVGTKNSAWFLANSLQEKV
jgi:hypothetical protein